MSEERNYSLVHPFCKWGRKHNMIYVFTEGPKES